MRADKGSFRGIRLLAWPLAHALVFGLTACGGTHAGLRGPAVAPRAPVEQRVSAEEAGWLPMARVETAACPADSIGDETESDPTYSFHPGDHILALTTPQQRVPSEQQAAESLGIYPEIGQPSFPLLYGEVRLAVEEGQGDPRHVVALRQASAGYCVIGVWMTAFGGNGTELAARAHWVAPDRSWMLVLVETIDHPRGIVLDEEHDQPGVEQRGWVALGTDGMRLWVAGVDRLDRYLKPSFHTVDGQVEIVDEDSGPHREARRLRVDADGQLVFAGG